MIFNQGITGQCMGYALLTALFIVDPTIDYQTIDAQLQAEPDNLAYPGRAEKWFTDRGYIESFDPIENIQMKALLGRGIPLVTGSNNGDFTTVTSPDFLLGFNDNVMFQHKYTIISDTETQYDCANSWGSAWGNAGHFNVNKSDFSRLFKPYRVLPKIINPHATILAKYMGGRVDYDGMYQYQCVDWIKEYSVLRNRSITSFGNAYQLWTQGLGAKWQKVPYVAGGALPMEGDVVCWGTSWGGGYGHIAIANKFCNTTVLRTCDQNAGSGNGDGLGANAISAKFRDYAGVVGWFKYIG